MSSVLHPRALRSIGFFAVLATLGASISFAACGGDSATSVGPGSDAGSDGTSAMTNDGSVGTGDGALGDGGVMTTAMQACADSAKSRCTRSDTCTNGTTNKSKYGDEATCESRVAAQCVKNLGAMSSGASASSVETCASAVPMETCTQFLGNDPDDTCLPPQGTLATSAPCGVSAQCQSTYCAIPIRTQCGVCAAPPKAGDPCGTTGECGGRAGLRCVNDTCITIGAVNDACSRSAPCGPDLSCVGDDEKTNTPGKCAAAVGMVDATCDPQRKTGPGCDNDLGLFCDPQTSKCVAVTFAGDGQPCGVVGNGFVDCTAGECIILQDSADGGDGGDAGDGGGVAINRTGTCKAFAADGQPCDGKLEGPHCMAPAKCIPTADTGTAGTCQLTDPSVCK